MNTDFIIEPNNSKLYNYYWNQITASVNEEDAQDFKDSLVERFGADAISNKTTNELCKYTMLALLVQVCQSSDDAGYALEFLKNGEINIDPSSYFNKLIASIQKTITISLGDITNAKKAIDVDKLRNSLSNTVETFYKKNPQFKGKTTPVKELQRAVAKTFDNALEIKKTLNPNLEKNQLNDL